VKLEVYLLNYFFLIPLYFLASPGFEITENPRAASAEGLGLIGSGHFNLFFLFLKLFFKAAAMMLSQHSGVSAPTEEEVFRADFSMPKLREFFECQKQMGIPNFPEDFGLRIFYNYFI